MEALKHETEVDTTMLHGDVGASEGRLLNVPKLVKKRVSICLGRDIIIS